MQKMKKLGKRICCFEGCDKLHHANGLCSTHNIQRHRLKPLVKIRNWGTEDACLFEGCDKPYYAKGLCCAHYYQRKKGKPLIKLRNYRKETKL